jgi:NTP pyrophosphatase (non-canonical NTP hydrolase)
MTMTGPTYRDVAELVHDDLNELPATAANIAAHLRGAGFTDHPHLRQILAVAEEAGEFVGAARRYYGLARRPGTLDELRSEAADVVITMFVAAHEIGFDLPAAIADKLAVIYRRGWREARTVTANTPAGDNG